MRALVAVAPGAPFDLAGALAQRGIAARALAPPGALTFALRAARRAARRSVPGRMLARNAFERAWGAYAARHLAREGADLVVADLAVAQALGRVTVPIDVLVLARGTVESIHRALDAEAARCPELRAHLTNYRASAETAGRERDAIASARRVVAPTRWIADSARAAGATDVVVVPPPVTEAASVREPPAPSRSGALRVRVAGVLIGRHGARPMLEAARTLGRALDVCFAGRIADDPRAIARWAGHFHLAPDEPLERALDETDVLAAPWLVDGRSLEVELALARGVPVVATAAAGVDDDTPGALRVADGSTPALVETLAALVDDSTRLALARATADWRREHAPERTRDRLATALLGGPSR